MNNDGILAEASDDDGKIAEIVHEEPQSKTADSNNETTEELSPACGYAQTTQTSNSFRLQTSQSLINRSGLSCKQFASYFVTKLKYACGNKLVFTVIILQLGLVGIYFSKILSTKVTLQIGLLLSVAGLLGLLAECSSTIRRRLEQENLARIRLNGWRVGGPVSLENDSANPYTHMVRGILMSQMQMNNASHYLTSMLSQGPDGQNREITSTNRRLIESFFIQQTFSLDQPVQNSSLSIEEIDRLMPVKTYQPKNNCEQGGREEDDKSSCTVCLEDFKLDDEVRISPCLHVYHKACIETWLGIRNICPNCKRILMEPIGMRLAENNTQE